MGLNVDSKMSLFIFKISEVTSLLKFCGIKSNVKEKEMYPYYLNEFGVKYMRN